MTEIYLIRHAQAEGNRYRMMQGHWDGDVTATGLRQIDALAERFRDLKVDALYSSDLYRTRKTASAICRYHHLEMHTTPLLREINVGRWETLFFGNVFHDEPELAHRFLFDQDRFSIEGGETYAQVADRAVGALEEIARRHEGQRVAVVSHGVTIRCMLARITGLSLQDTEHLPICRNTAVTRLRWEDGRFTVLEINDYSHLAGLGDVPWSKNGDLRHEILDPRGDRDYYCACYADAWKSAHGSLDGFWAEPYWNAAVQHHRAQEGSVLRMYWKESPVGLIDMDPRRGAHAGYGWISLLYLAPEYRYQGYGVQLLARAVSLYRSLGRQSLRLHVAEENAPARAFYEKEGFRQLSWEEGGSGRLLLMEKKLKERRDV